MQYTYDCNYCYIGDDSNLEEDPNYMKQNIQIIKKNINKLLKNGDIEFNKLIILQIFIL